MKRLRHGFARGERRTLTYRIWTTMKSRCGRSNAGSFEFYGGRGIRVCARWMRFENFLSDMGECPPGHQLDRIDNNRHYEPGNCRWATPKQNARNRRNTRWLTVAGVTKSLHEWAELYRLNVNTLAKRLGLGWDPLRALTEPLQHRYYGAKSAAH